MEKGDRVRVKSTGKEGTVETVINDNTVMVEFDATFKNKQAGRVHIQHAVWNLEPVKDKNG